MRKDIQKLAEIMEAAERNGNKEPKPEYSKPLPDCKPNLPAVEIANAADANSIDPS